MAAPVWQAAGTFQGLTTGMTVAWPAHAIDDIGLLVFESCGGEPVTLTTSAGFVAVTNSPQATGTTTLGTQISVYWCRATSTSMASPVAADAGNHLCGVIVTARGCILTGDPWDVTAGAVKAADDLTVSMPGLTTTVADCLVLPMLARASDEATTAQFSAESNADIAGLTERIDNGTVNGNGGGIYILSGTKATAGAIGATTATMAQSSILAYLTIALKPPAGAATTSPPPPRRTPTAILAR